MVVLSEVEVRLSDLRQSSLEPVKLNFDWRMLNILAFDSVCLCPIGFE